MLTIKSYNIQAAGELNLHQNNVTVMITVSESNNTNLDDLSRLILAELLTVNECFLKISFSFDSCRLFNLFNLD